MSRVISIRTEDERHMIAQLSLPLGGMFSYLEIFPIIKDHVIGLTTSELKQLRDAIDQVLEAQGDAA